MECPPTLDEVDKDLRCVYSRWSTTDEIDHSTAAGKELKNRMELNVSDWLGEEPFISIRGLLHIVRGKSGIPSVSKALPWPYHRLYLNRFYREGLLKNRSIYNEG